MDQSAQRSESCAFSSFLPVHSATHAASPAPGADSEAMASSQGVQMLLNAEKKAAEIVKNARARML
jgi:hypothetical protein